MLGILFTFLILLLLIFFIIYRSEYWIKKNNAPGGKVEEYWVGEERRKTVRLNIPLEVKYTAANGNHNSLTKNISQGGIQLLIYERLNIGDIINLEVKLDTDNPPVMGQGRIVWLYDIPKQSNQEGKRAFLIGIKFINLAPKDEERLGAFIYNKCAGTILC